MSLIAKNLWLGGIDVAYNRSFLLSTQITHILNCADDASVSSYPLDLSLNIVQIPMEDDKYSGFEGDLQTAVRTLDTWISEGRTILVHCVAGMSRSPTVLMAWMILCKRKSFDEAWRHIANRRPIIRPNDYFMKCLKDLQGLNNGP